MAEKKENDKSALLRCSHDRAEELAQAGCGGQKMGWIRRITIDRSLQGFLSHPALMGSSEGLLTEVGRWRN